LTDSLSQTLCELGRVDRVAELGTNGPLLASAGAHSLFHCLFGRDALRMADDLLHDFPSVARATLLDLARLQGVRNNPRGEEEPGRILHEFRAPDDPHAIRLSASGWDFPYYGAVDTTPQWINLLGAYCRRQGVEILDEMLTDQAFTQAFAIFPSPSTRNEERMIPSEPFFRTPQAPHASATA